MYIFMNYKALSDILLELLDTLIKLKKTMKKGWMLSITSNLSGNYFAERYVDDKNKECF